MKIPFSDLGAQHKELNKEMFRAIRKVAAKGDFILGENVGLFEKEFAGFCGSKFSVGVSSGTAALFLALKALDIKEGDEVIVPVFTFIATALAVSYTGAKPVFVDIDENTYNIDVKKIEKAVTKKTKAIIPVHLFGQPADMPAILKLARKYNLKVIEDAAQAHGAEIDLGGGKTGKAGSIGDIGCFSFYPSKNLGALGDAGAVTTSDEKIFKKIFMLHDCGRVSKYEHAVVGYNSRLDTLQAALLRIKLKKLGTWNNMRIKAANIYNGMLKDIPGLTPPYAAGGLKHVYHVYAIRSKKRGQLIELFKEKGVSAIIHYPIPLHLQPAYKELGYKKGDFPVAEGICGEILSLPMYPHIKKGQIEYIAKLIRKII
ncbi:MAG: DegT/DnrJ/EryC1/StrS family aminotransferase [Candidatus Omnitrophica bacterium]|nr:DegT/DnrJ/EryC1/StrS family aminotransferase [Candidatus Omnitrophota bacterium]